MVGSAPARAEKAWIAKTVSPCSELRLDHTKNTRQRWMVRSAQAMGKPQGLSLLGSATWSVPDFVRTDLRTERLAIAIGDRRDKALHPSKSQQRHHPPL